MDNNSTLILKQKIYEDAIDYYRKHPDEFIEDVLGIKINFYQVLMVRGTFNSKFSCYICSRGLGKTWLAVLILVTYGLLYPNTKIGIIAPSFRQAKKAIEEKYKESICRLSPFVEQEEEDYKCSVQQAEVTFYNGTKITAYPIGSDGSRVRGARLNFLFVDEAFAMYSWVYELVLKPMTVVKPDYKVGEKNDESSNKILIASTAGYRENWLYKIYVEWTRKMLEGDKKYYTMSLPYTVGLRANLYDEDIINDALNTMTEAGFEQEYGGVFSKLIDGAWIKYDDLEKCCNLDRFETSGDPQFEYIMAVDVARVSGQDNTVMMVFKLNWIKDHFEPEIVYIKALNGASFELQASEYRELLRRFPKIIKVFQDTMTLGQGLTDELAKPFYYEPEEKYYPPLLDVNNAEAMKNIDNSHGVPLIYGITAGAEINHKCGYAIKNYTEKGWVHFYCNSMIGNNGHMTKEETLLQLQTSEMKKEVLSIETNGVYSGWMKFMTKGKRKDRWSALGMGLYGIDIIKKERTKQTNTKALLGVARLNTNRKGRF